MSDGIVSKARPFVSEVHPPQYALGRSGRLPGRAVSQATCAFGSRDSEGELRYETRL